MPNHIANKLIVKSDSAIKIQYFLERIKGSNNNDSKEQIIDFNTIIQMPQMLVNTEESSRTNNALYYYIMKSGKEHLLNKVMAYSYLYKMDRFEKLTEEELEENYKLGEQYFNNYLKCGATTWYDWAYRNWGTKWNAYHSEIEYPLDDNGNISNTCVIVRFQTAWNGVPNIIEKMVELFPDLHFTYKYADEDMTHNCGEGDGNYENGFYFNRIESGSDDAMATYIECWDEDEDDFIKHNGKWTRLEWLDEEDEENEEDE